MRWWYRARISALGVPSPGSRYLLGTSSCLGGNPAPENRTLISYFCSVASICRIDRRAVNYEPHENFRVVRE